MTERKIAGAIMLATGLTVPEYAAVRGYSKSTIYLNIRGVLQSKAVQEMILADVATITAPVEIVFPPRPGKGT